MGIKSLYIHIPFCKHICSYCDFSKIMYDENIVHDYLNALEQEIKEYYNNEQVETIYVGGGTPSALSDNALDKLFKILKFIDTTNLKEFTFECNVSDITEELIKTLVENKVNRISIGVESFNKNKLKFMERTAEFNDVKEKINLIKSMGIENINVDLMYGIPNESLSDLKNDLKMLLKLDPTHISTYSLILERHTKISSQDIEQIEDEEELKMYEYIIKKLQNKKYTHYEISNFSKEGYESIHNLTYWNNEEYYGFGLGAHGYIEGFRYENTRNIKEYIKGNFRLEEKLISKQEQMENEVMLGLRKIKGINLEDFYDKYEVNMQDVFPIKPLIKNKELVYKDGYVFINPEKIYIMNEILLKLI